MNQWKFYRRVNNSFLACFTLLITHATVLYSAQPAEEKVLATARSPARHCMTYDVATYRALKEDRKRAVVVVKAFKPTMPPAGLIMWLYAGGKRHEVTRFAVYPLRGYTAQESHRTQRFLVSLAEHAALVEQGKPLCLEVGFDSTQGEGEAEINIDMVNN